MAWTKTAGTRHTCGGPSFGRLAAGCPRCDELAAGAPARQWAGMGRRQRCAAPQDSRRADRARRGRVHVALPVLPGPRPLTARRPGCGRRRAPQFDW